MTVKSEGYRQPYHQSPQTLLARRVHAVEEHFALEDGETRGVKCTPGRMFREKAHQAKSHSDSSRDSGSWLYPWRDRAGTDLIRADLTPAEKALHISIVAETKQGGAPDKAGGDSWGVRP
jgi:hypothetical protein